MRFRSTHSILLAALLVMASCSNVKHLPAGDSLYTGSKASIKDENADKKERKNLVNKLEGSVRPKANSKILGMRLKLAIYNYGGRPRKKKGIRVWLHNKVGEPPVLASSVSITKNQSIMQNLLQNNGFFKATVNGEASTKHKKTELYFDVSTGKQFIINKTVFIKDSDQVYYDIDSDFKKTLLHPGAPYNLDLIKAERNRIDKGLKEKGYYYFTPAYIFVQVDTNLGDNKIDMFVKLKQDSIPDNAYNIYHIHDIVVYRVITRWERVMIQIKATQYCIKSYI